MAEGRSVLIVLDRERHIRYDFNSLADLDQALDLMGTSLATLPKDASKMRLGHLRAFVWAGLLHEDPTLTQRDAGRLVQAWVDQGQDVGTLSEKLLEALQLSGYASKPTLVPASTEGAPAAPLAEAGSPPPST